MNGAVLFIGSIVMTRQEAEAFVLDREQVVVTQAEHVDEMRMRPHRVEPAKISLSDFLLERCNGRAYFHRNLSETSSDVVRQRHKEVQVVHPGYTNLLDDACAVDECKFCLFRHFQSIWKTIVGHPNSPAKTGDPHCYRCCGNNRQVEPFSLSLSISVCGNPESTYQGANGAYRAHPDTPIAGFHTFPGSRVFDVPCKEQHPDESKETDGGRKQRNSPVQNFLMHVHLDVEKFPNRSTAFMPNY